MELIYSVKFSLKLLEDKKAQFSSDKFYYGRIIVIIFTTAYALAAFTIFLIGDLTLDMEQRSDFCTLGAEYYNSAMQITDFTLLTCSVCALFYYLKK